MPFSDFIFSDNGNEFSESTEFPWSFGVADVGVSPSRRSFFLFFCFFCSTDSCFETIIPSRLRVGYTLHTTPAALVLFLETNTPQATRKQRGYYCYSSSSGSSSSSSSRAAILSNSPYAPQVEYIGGAIRASSGARGPPRWRVLVV